VRPNIGLLAAMAAVIAAEPRNTARRTRSLPDARTKRPQKRLRMARGAGSINAKADTIRLAQLGRFKEAADMAEAHRRQCHEHLFPQFVVDTWRRYAEESL
jgi:hypothetical protein